MVMEEGRRFRRSYQSPKKVGAIPAHRCIFISKASSCGGSPGRDDPHEIACEKEFFYGAGRGKLATHWVDNDQKKRGYPGPHEMGKKDFISHNMHRPAAA